MSKVDRRNYNRQQMLKKQREHSKEISVFNGRDGAPRVVAVIPLCPDIDTRAVVNQLSGSLNIDTASISLGAPTRVSVDRFKQKLQFIPIDPNAIAPQCYDATSIADFVLFILSAVEEVDQKGELIIRGVEGLGLSTMFTAVQHLDKLSNIKEKNGVISSLKSFITHFHPEQDKIYNVDSRQDCSNLMRSLCTTTPKGIRWRDERSWMVVEEFKGPGEENELATLTGVVRGKGLKADRLVQVGDLGTFQIDRIEAAPLTRKNNSDGMNIDDEPHVVDRPTADQDTLDELAPLDHGMLDNDTEMDSESTAAMSAVASARKGVFLDDYQYFSDDDKQEREIPKSVPKGTSKYQSAWFVGDEELSDTGSDLDNDIEMEQVDDPVPEDGIEGQAAVSGTEGAPTEYAKSVVFEEMEEDREAEELEHYRAKKRDEALDDLEFPDEIELHPNVIARERLLKYRGLRSLRESTWDEDADAAHEPEYWPRMLRFKDYKGSRVRAAREALVGGVPPGTRVRVYIRGIVPEKNGWPNGSPLSMFSLLRHENKRTVLNFHISLPSDYPFSIKSKEEFFIHCGPRRFRSQVVFSQPGSTPNDVHKFCRYLHPGQSTVASFIGPLTWGSVPTVFFRETSCKTEEQNHFGHLKIHLAAIGTSMPPSTSRIIAKRLILTGHPYHIHKKVVTIRYMFFNREDVEYFKALPLWTKRGRIGHIKEALGTHGYFKALFNERINPQDTIGVSLYKRVWPRNATFVAGSAMYDPEDLKAAAGALEEDMNDDSPMEY